MSYCHKPYFILLQKYIKKYDRKIIFSTTKEQFSSLINNIYKIDLQLLKNMKKNGHSAK